MAIAFNQIPTILRTPGTYSEFDASRAVQGIAPLPSKILVVGSMFTGGSEEGSPLTPYTILSNTDGDRLFGVGSQLARMLKKLKGANELTEVTAIGAVDDGAGVAATKTATIVGTASEDGVLQFLVAGQRMPVAVSSGDTATDMAAAVVAAVTADTELPFTAANVAGVVTFTARHAAAFTQDLDIRLNYFDREALPAGVTSVTIADAVSGATNPDVATVIAVLPEEFFTTVITGWNDSANMGLLETEALRRWGPLVQQDMHIIAAVAGDFSALSTYGSGRNSQFSSAMGAGESPSPDYEWAAVLGAVEEAEPDPARPRQTLRLPGLLAPARADQFIQSERNLLLQAGVATHIVDQGGNVFIERLITTYQTNALGTDDPTFLDITTLRTLFALRYTWNTRISLKYPRHKLADDGTVVAPGQPIVTPSTIRGEAIAIYGEWTDQGWVEGAALDQFKDELVVLRNASDVNRIDIQLPPDIINQFRVLASQFQFLL